MNFDLSDEQRQFEDTIGRYFELDFPLAAVREVLDGDTGRSDVVWKGLAALGVLGVCIPDRYGGMGLELLDLAVAAEALGFAAAPGTFLEHVLAAIAITLGGSDEQRGRWLPHLADGSRRATFAVAEPGDRWLSDQLRLRGGPSLTGTKRHVLNPEGVDVVVVATDGGFVVAEPSVGTAVKHVEVLDRTRRVADVTFSDEAAEVLPNGAAACSRVFDAALVLLAADAAGAARRCLEMAVAYAKVREQFGVTIGHFQALKHHLADMALDVAQLAPMHWYAAHAWDHLPDVVSRAAALAKAHVTERAVEAGRSAIEVHGGVGYTWACDAHIFLKRALFDRAYCGGPGFHRARVAAMNGWPSAG